MSELAKNTTDTNLKRPHSNEGAEETPSRQENATKDQIQENSMKKPKLNAHLVSEKTEGARYKDPSTEAFADVPEDQDDIQGLLVEGDGVLRNENDTVDLKDIVDEYDTGNEPQVPRLPASVVEIPTTETPATFPSTDGKSLQVAAEQSTEEKTAPILPIIEKPAKPAGPVSVPKSKITGKYHLLPVTKNESLHARSYLKHHGAADFLDTYLPAKLNTLHIYHVIRLLGFQIREKELLVAISQVIDNPDFILPKDAGSLNTNASAGRESDNSDSESSEDDDDNDEDENVQNDGNKKARVQDKGANDEQTQTTRDFEPLHKKYAIKLIKDLQKAINKVLCSRIRLTNFYTIDHVLEKLKTAQKVLVLTGAGISTSLGIPDFRSSEGFYSKIKHLGLDDPQDVFNYDIFMDDPAVFYNIAHMILPPDGLYSPLHSFIKLLQDKGKLLRNYTQNIDNLESFAGIESEKMIQCHGSFATATCKTCNWQIPGEKIFKYIRNCELPLCPYCFVKRQKIYPTTPVTDETFYQAKYDKLNRDIEEEEEEEEKEEEGDGDDDDDDDNDLLDEFSVASDTKNGGNTQTNDSLSSVENSSNRQYDEQDSASAKNDQGSEAQHNGSQVKSNLGHDLYFKSYGVMKPDITFFGEALPAKFHKFIKRDALECDLLICIGTSLKVAPVSEIVNMVPPHVPQILINRDDVKHCEFDVSFLGLCDDVAGYLSQRMGWDIPHDKWFEKMKQQQYDVENVDRGVYHIQKKGDTMRQP